jgi:Arc/MetJ-type ribon-helix-helix transcriptional regulator
MHTEGLSLIQKCCSTSLKQHQTYGFKDKSEAVRFALQLLQQSLEQKHLQESAELYAQLYEEDPEIKDLAETALADWPE